MLTAGILISLVGLLLIAGGTMGHIKRNSLPSLIGGVTIGLMQIYCGIFTEPKHRLAYDNSLPLTVGIVGSILLLLVGGMRLMQANKKVLPIVFLGLGSFCLLLQLHMLQWIALPLP